MNYKFIQLRLPNNLLDMMTFNILKEPYWDQHFQIKQPLGNKKPRAFHKKDQGKDIYTTIIRTPYFIIGSILKKIKPERSTVICDIGCGEGTFVNVIAQVYPDLNKVIGLELVKKVYENALQNSRKSPYLKAPIKIYNSDAAKFNLDEITIFYMYHPFNSKEEFRTFLDNLQQSLLSKPRKITLIYHYPAYIDLLSKENCPFLKQIDYDQNSETGYWENINYPNN